MVRLKQVPFAILFISNKIGTKVGCAYGLVWFGVKIANSLKLSTHFCLQRFWNFPNPGSGFYRSSPDHYRMLHASFMQSDANDQGAEKIDNKYKFLGIFQKSIEIKNYKDILLRKFSLSRG